MKKIGIIIASLLICSISYAAYVTIEKEKIAIGDNTKVIGELPIQKRVEVVGETKNRYIIKYNSHLAGIDKKRLRFPKDEQPYIYPYVGMSEQIYEVTLELYKGEEYKVIKEDKTRYLIEYPLKESSIEIWLEKKCVSYNELSRLERFEQEQLVKGLVKYKDNWMTPEEKYELEQELKGLVKYKGRWVTPKKKLESEQKAFELEQKAKGLVKYGGGWVTPEKKLESEQEVYEVEQELKGLTKHEGKWLTHDQLQEARKITVTVEEGSFVFKNLSLTAKNYLEYLGTQVKGDVSNNTSKDWYNVTFEAGFYNNVGDKVDSCSFTLHHFKRDETKSFSSYERLSLRVKDAAILRCGIQFLTGEYPAYYIFVMTEPTVNKGLIYEDLFLKIVFFITQKEFHFTLQNRTENPIKIDWNQVSYVDVQGKSHKVIHSEVKYTDKAKPQPTTVIPPTAKLEDIVLPIDYIYYKTGKHGGWREKPLFPEAPEAKIFKGRSFSVFMPLEINGAIKNYLFSFKIEDVES